MKTEKTKQPYPLPGLTREEEEQQLAVILKAAQENLTRTETYIRQLTDELDDLMEVYGTKDKEALALFHNAHSQIRENRRDLLRCQKARKKPYFGRIDFKDPKQPVEESYYVGRVGISDSDARPLVIDWRAPVASVYYENAIGPCTYQVKNEGRFEIDLKRKRTYEIEQDRLKDFYDSDVVANDELLTQYLAKSKKAVLGEIIATIQKEQNAMIRHSPKTNLIVQGVAGSGKTTVAMHRISYILYNYDDQFRPEDFYIIGSNRILLDYITSVLPDLDVYGILQMTMEQLFTRLLYEDWDPLLHKIRPVDQTPGVCIKGNAAWFADLEQFCEAFEQAEIPRTDIRLPENGKLLLSGSEIGGYLQTMRFVSMQARINMLNEILLSRLETELSGKNVSYPAAEKKELHRKYRWHFGKDVFKGSIFELYTQFLQDQQQKGKPVPYMEHAFDVYDLAALAYLYKRVKETDSIREASHVIIDEAQDYGMMAYHALAYCLRGCTYTIMGDVSQNIHFGYGLNDWRELQQLILTGTYDHFGLLKKSYRNTVEISEFATEILRHGNFPIYPVEPISRHGSPVNVTACASKKAMVQEMATIIQKWQHEGRGTIAVICRDEAEAETVGQSLSAYLPVADSCLETAEFGSGVMTLPVEYTKGLEFDAVILYNPSAVHYPAQDACVKLLYVAATRALHELAVIHKGDLTDLIAKPVSAQKRMQSLENELRKEPKRYTKKETTAREQQLLKARQGEKERAARSYFGPKPICVQQPAAKSQTPGEGNDTLAANGSSVRTDRQTEAGGYSAARNNRPAKAGSPSSVGKDTRTQTDFQKLARLQPSGKKKPQDAPINTSPYRFGTCPDSSLLRPKGHARIDNSVRIVKKAKTYIELISSYGVLRITPIQNTIIRIQFQKNGSGGLTPCYWDRTPQPSGFWKVKEGKQLAEITTGSLSIRVDRKTGAVQFLDPQGKQLLTEKADLPRQTETDGVPQHWVYFDWAKSEPLFVKGILADDLERVNQKARYISFGGKKMRLPLLVSGYGYGIAPAAEQTAMCCTIPMYGTYLYTEGSKQIDYYFLYGGSLKAVLELYRDLTL